MKNNLLIIDERETGKTTYLLKEIDRLINDGFNVIILDSATEHENKSLLKKVCKKYNNTSVIDMQDETKITLDEVNPLKYVENFTKFFPFNEIISNKEQIIGFDLAYFLEKGHDIYDETNDRDAYYYYRNLYNMLSQQIVLSLTLMDNSNLLPNTVVVMDEIEFPKVDYDISLFQKDLTFLASVHQENAFGTFYKSFDRINFLSYQKRKD